MASFRAATGNCHKIKIASQRDAGKAIPYHQVSPHSATCTLIQANRLPMKCVDQKVPIMRKRFLIFTLFSACAALLLFHYKERHTYICQICQSSKHVFQWKLGFWPDESVPLSPKWQHVDETKFYHDFFIGGHIHIWKFAQGSPYYFFGTTWGGCALGSGCKENGPLHIYESDSEFRAFVQGKLQNGTLDRLAVISHLPAPSQTLDAKITQNDIEAVLEEYWKQ